MIARVSAEPRVAPRPHGKPAKRRAMPIPKRLPAKQRAVESRAG